MNEIENYNGMIVVNKGEYTDINFTKSFKSDEDDQIVAHYTKYEAESPVERDKFEGVDIEVDTICCDESLAEELPSIPDGGWGWVVVASAFFILAYANGLASTFSVLYVEFAIYFNVDLSNSDLIIQIFTTTSFFSGPIMSVLVEQYGCRFMTITAGLFSTCAFVLAAVSNSIEMLCLTLGFMGGLGVGVLHITATVSVLFWFDKRRNVAISLAFSGIRFAELIYYRLTEYLVDVLKLRLTLTLLSGNFLIICVCGILMRNPEWLQLKQMREHKLSERRSKKGAGEGLTISSSLSGGAVFNADKLKVPLQSGKTPEYILTTLTSTIDEAEELKAALEINAGHPIHSSTFVQQNEKMCTPWYHRLGRSIQSTIDFRMILFSISYFMLSLWSDVPYLFLNKHIRNNLYIFIDIACAVGTVIFGWAGDHPWTNVTKTYAGCLIICGISVAAYPLFMTSYWTLAALSVIFGFSFASSFSYTPAILLGLLPFEHFTAAYGVLLLIRGIGRLLMPHIVRLLLDIGGYVECYVAGMCLLISGCCLGLIVFMKDERLHGAEPLLKETELTTSDANNVEV